MFRIKQNIVRLFVIASALTIIWSCSGVPAEYLTIDGEALGTFVQVKCENVVASDKIVQLVKKVDNEAKKSMSIFDDNSLISKVNKNLTDSLDRHILRNLEIAEHFWQISGGAYDVTVKPLTEAWGFAKKRNTELTPNVDSLLEFVGFDKIRIEEQRLIKSDDRIQLDFNSIAKGYTVDILAEELEALGIQNYMVNIGGEIRCRGCNARGEVWSIGIETPYEGNMGNGSFERIIRRTDCAIATSGNYRRYYINNEGRKVVHTIDPRTGYSTISNLLSATVIAPTCAEADAAATMLMAKGADDSSNTSSKELAEWCEKEYGWLYYLIYADGDDYRIECSSAFKE